MGLERLTNGKMPAICTPLTGRTQEEVLDQLHVVCKEEPDVIEWRADFLRRLSDEDEVLHIVREIKSKTTIPLMFTIRAEHEGGEEISLSRREKVALLKRVCEETDVDVIDFELSNNKADVVDLRDVAQATNTLLILSYHNFERTPSDEELLDRAQEAESFGADVAKLALMPRDKEDVLRLLRMTNTIDNMLGIPVVTISMGELGGLSRIVGWTYGSVLTFGVGVESSAPGQMPVRELRAAIQQMQQLIPSWSE